MGHKGSKLRAMHRETIATFFPRRRDSFGVTPIPNLEKPLPPIRNSTSIMERPPPKARVPSDIDCVFDSQWSLFEAEWKNNTLVVDAAGAVIFKRDDLKRKGKHIVTAPDNQSQ